MTPPATAVTNAQPRRRITLPRLGFLGLGWIGRRRLQSIVDAGACHVVALADNSETSLDQARLISPTAIRGTTLEALLAQDLDGIVIATPSGLHADQCLAALSRGVAVFCQKPLARTAEETRRILTGAQSVDCLLGIDFSYRHAHAFAHALEVIRSGALGMIHHVDLTFHNAYGPDKGWCKDRALSGGGCLIDLGVHLIDYALLALNSPVVGEVSARLYSQGTPVTNTAQQIEDFANAEFTTVNDTTVRLACSWWASIGQGAVIEAVFHGQHGAVRVANIDGSFFDFRCEHMSGDKRETLIEPPDAWEGRALVTWADQLARSPRYDPSVESAVRVAEVLDRMYAA